jgi:hypothetical protein
VVIIDPFSGTGSAGVAALRSGSYYIGMDTDEECVVCIHDLFACVLRNALLVTRECFQPMTRHAQNSSMQWLESVRTGEDGDQELECSGLVPINEVITKLLSVFTCTLDCAREQ